MHRLFSLFTRKKRFSDKKVFAKVFPEMNHPITPEELDAYLDIIEKDFILSNQMKIQKRGRIDVLCSIVRHVGRENKIEHSHHNENSFRFLAMLIQVIMEHGGRDNFIRKASKNRIEIVDNLTKHPFSL